MLNGKIKDLNRSPKKISIDTDKINNKFSLKKSIIVLRLKFIMELETIFAIPNKTRNMRMLKIPSKRTLAGDFFIMY